MKPEEMAARSGEATRRMERGGKGSRGGGAASDRERRGPRASLELGAQPPWVRSQ